MRVLVTGANGFVGSHLTEALVKRGDRVTCLVRRTSNLAWIKNLPVDFVYGELSDPASLPPAVDGIDLAFHVAALTRAPDRETFFRVNSAGTENLCRALAESGSDGARFVFVSSLAAGGPGGPGQVVTENDPDRPVSWYGFSKLEAEAAVKRLLDNWVIVRPPAVYGPRDDGLYLFHRMATRGFILIPGGFEKIFSLIHSDDLVTGLLAAAGKPNTSGKTFYLSDGSIYAWERLIPVFRSILGTDIKARYLPAVFHTPIMSLLQAWDHLSQRPGALNHQKMIELKQHSWACDNSLARVELGFHPTISIQDGFRDCYRWYRAEGWL
ncbi:NAD-dependent epimerase/dehydratase family protein [candidate division KSB1 bacterium]